MPICLLTVKGRQQALARLEILRQEWREVMPSDKVRSLAEKLPDGYGLRALDSFQLAAALVWCKEKPKNQHSVPNLPRDRHYSCFQFGYGAAERISSLHLPITCTATAIKTMPTMAAAETAKLGERLWASGRRSLVAV